MLKCGYAHEMKVWSHFFVPSDVTVSIIQKKKKIELIYCLFVGRLEIAEHNEEPKFMIDYDDTRTTSYRKSRLGILTEFLSKDRI